MTKALRRGAVALVILAVLGGALLADLSNQGLAWRLFYNLTGEDAPAAQLVGMTHWAGRWLRPQPETAPYVPVNHADVNPFGINVFLEQEAEIEKRERILQMIGEAGFVWLRQEFPWEDIEIHERGDFIDKRNDRNGDGVIDEADHISAWDKYDNIVDLVEQYDLRLMVRLSNPPSWTHSNPDIGEKAPPDNLEDYINYVTAVAERYQGRIFHYQVWNEPNIYPEWGNQDVNPEAYTEMLCAAYDALKAIDPEIVVISGALAPTNSMNYRDLNDFIFFQRMMDAGAGTCFDVLAMQGYGLNSGPTDRRLRPQTVNFSRLLYTRDMLVQNGYPDKAIWISEAAWNPVPSEAEVPDIVGRYTYGQVTEEQAARYMVEAYERFQEEWPWGGVMFYWFFKRAADYEQNQSFYYFRMTEPDFTPLPIYDAIKQYTETLTPTLYKGVHQENHWAMTLADDAERVTADAAQFDHAIRTSFAEFVAHGTGLAIRWQDGDSVQVFRDGELINTLASDDEATYTGEGGWHELRLRLSWTAQPHTIRIEATNDAMLLDAVTVYDHTVRDVGILVTVFVLIVGAFVSGVLSVRRSEMSTQPTTETDK